MGMNVNEIPVDGWGAEREGDLSDTMPELPWMAEERYKRSGVRN